MFCDLEQWLECWWHISAAALCCLVDVGALPAWTVVRLTRDERQALAGIAETPCKASWCVPTILRTSWNVAEGTADPCRATHRVDTALREEIVSKKTKKTRT